MRAPLLAVLLAGGLAAPVPAQDAAAGHGRAVLPGGIIGAIAGAAAGVFLGAIVNGTCEVDCGSAAGDMAAGGLLGGAAGAAVGGLVGAAVPRGPGNALELGEASLRLGAVTATTDDPDLDGTGPVVDGAFGPRFGPVAVLLEGGWGRISSDRHVWRWGGAVRADLARGAWRPYAVAGLGGYSDRWTESDGLQGQVTWFGGSIGAGVRRGWPGAAFSLSAEGRLHARLQDVGPPQGGPAVEFVTLFVAGHVGW